MNFVVSGWLDTANGFIAVLAAFEMLFLSSLSLPGCWLSIVLCFFRPQVSLLDLVAMLDRLEPSLTFCLVPWMPLMRRLDPKRVNFQSSGGCLVGLMKRLYFWV